MFGEKRRIHINVLIANRMCDRDVNSSMSEMLLVSIV